MAPRKAQSKKGAATQGAGKPTTDRVTRSQTAAAAAPPGPTGVKKPAAKPAPGKTKYAPQRRKKGNQGRGGAARGQRQAPSIDEDEDEDPPRAPGWRPRQPARPKATALPPVLPVVNGEEEEEEEEEEDAGSYGSQDSRLPRKRTSSGMKRRTPRSKIPAAGDGQEDDDSPRGRRRTPRTPPRFNSPLVSAPPPPVQDDRASEGNDDPPTEAQIAREQGEELAMVQDSTQCTFREIDARLTVKLQVHRDPDQHDSRVGYRARLTLHHDMAFDIPQGDAGDIYSWRISKPTAALPNANVQNFRREIMLPGIENVGPEIRETACCMRALYTQQGVAKARFRDADVRNQLTNSLIFIEMIYIRPDFARQGLLQHALRLYHDMLGTLPEWYAFAGTVVLVPSRPEGMKGDAWGTRDDDEVEQALQRAYGRHGGYEVFGNNVNVSGRAITVMGRTVPDAAAAVGGEDGDQAQ